MNDFEGLNSWIKEAKKEPTEREQALALLKSMPWFQKMQRIEETITDKQTIQEYWDACCDEGELLRESDGQFTGGVWSQAWKFNNKEYEFTFHENEFIDLVIHGLEEK